MKKSDKPICLILLIIGMVVALISGSISYYNDIFFVALVILGSALGITFGIKIITSRSKDNLDLIRPATFLITVLTFIVLGNYISIVSDNKILRSIIYSEEIFISVTGFIIVLFTLVKVFMINDKK